MGYLIPIIFFMFWMGIYPNTFMRKMDASVNNLINLIEQKDTVFAEAKNMKREKKNMLITEKTVSDNDSKKEVEQP